MERGTQLATDGELDASGCPAVSADEALPAPYSPGAAPTAAVVGGGAAHDHSTHDHGVAAPAAPADVSIAGDAVSAQRPVGAPPAAAPLGAAAVALGMIVLVLRLMARRAWS